MYWRGIGNEFQGAMGELSKSMFPIWIADHEWYSKNYVDKIDNGLIICSHLIIFKNVGNFETLSQDDWLAIYENCWSSSPKSTLFIENSFQKE